jgi:hypothetical protein
MGKREKREIDHMAAQRTGRRDWSGFHMGVAWERRRPACISAPEARALRIIQSIDLQGQSMPTHAADALTASR